MASIKTEYGSVQALTITLASLADSATAGRESTAVSNTTDKFLDVLVSARIKPQNSGSISAPSAVLFYVAASIDGGTDYPDAVAGTGDAAVTINSPHQLKLLGVINVAAINVSYKGGPWSVAQLFGGKMPEKWVIVAINDCGTALSATGSDHFVKYQGVYASSA